MKRQHREKTILPAINALITRRALDEINVDRKSLAKELIAEIKSRFPDKIPPTVETLKKKISGVRSHEVKAEDQLFWSLFYLRKYDISPEAIGTVFELQQTLLNKRLKNRAVDSPKLLTIREAYWASKLYPIINAYFSKEGKDDMLGALEYWSREYAALERAAELNTNVPLDTHELDHLLAATKGRYDRRSINIANGLEDEYNSWDKEAKQ